VVLVSLDGLAHEKQKLKTVFAVREECHYLLGALREQDGHWKAIFENGSEADLALDSIIKMLWERNIEVPLRTQDELSKNGRLGDEKDNTHVTVRKAICDHMNSTSAAHGNVVDVSEQGEWSNVHSFAASELLYDRQIAVFNHIGPGQVVAQFEKQNDGRKKVFMMANKSKTHYDLLIPASDAAKIQYLITQAEAESFVQVKSPTGEEFYVLWCAEDGNCFFRAWAKYLRLYEHKAPIFSCPPKTHEAQIEQWKFCTNDCKKENDCFSSMRSEVMDGDTTLGMYLGHGIHGTKRQGLAVSLRCAIEPFDILKDSVRARTHDQLMPTVVKKLVEKALERFTKDAKIFQDPDECSPAREPVVHQSPSEWTTLLEALLKQVSLLPSFSQTRENHVYHPKPCLPSDLSFCRMVTRNFFWEITRTRRTRTKLSSESSPLSRRRRRLSSRGRRLSRRLSLNNEQQN
jgi:hypothetical protein